MAWSINILFNSLIHTKVWEFCLVKGFSEGNVVLGSVLCIPHFWKSITPPMLRRPPPCLVPPPPVVSSPSTAVGAFLLLIKVSSSFYVRGQSLWLWLVNGEKSLSFFWSPGSQICPRSTTSFYIAAQIRVKGWSKVSFQPNSRGDKSHMNFYEILPVA